MITFRLLFHYTFKYLRGEGEFFIPMFHVVESEHPPDLKTL